MALASFGRRGGWDGGTGEPIDYSPNDVPGSALPQMPQQVPKNIDELLDLAEASAGLRPQRQPRKSADMKAFCKNDLLAMARRVAECAPRDQERREGLLLDLHEAAFDMILCDLIDPKEAARIVRLAEKEWGKKP